MMGRPEYLTTPLLVALVLFFAAPSFAQSRRRVMIVDIDGVRRDTFAKAYLGGRLRNFERILGPVVDGKGFSTTFRFENATAVLPSVTMAGQASLFSGVYPAVHSIVGNEWFDRSSGQFVDYMSITGIACVYGVSLFDAAGCRGGLANNHLRAPTIYEIAAGAGKSSLVVFNQYWRGATAAVQPSILDALRLVQGDSMDFEALDRRMMDHAIETLIANGLPDILSVYFAGADAIAHNLGTSSQIAYLENVIDPEMGRLLDLVESLDREWREETLFVITADHGRTDVTPVPEDERTEGLIQDALGRAGFDAEHVLLAKNGGMAHLYLRSRGSQTPWSDAPSPEDLSLAAGELFRDQRLGFALEFILLREAGPQPIYSLYGETETGQKQVRDIPEPFKAQIQGLESERSGDLVILLREGRYFLRGSQNGAAAGSQHGGIHPNDLAIPLLLAQGGIAPGASAAPASTVNIAATIAGYLEISADGLQTPLPGVAFRRPDTLFRRLPGRMRPGGSPLTGDRPAAAFPAF